MHKTDSFFRRTLLAISISLSAITCALAQLPQPTVAIPVVKPTSGPWDSGTGFAFDLGKKKTLKTRQSVSGIACNLNAHQQRICLLAFDEGVEASMPPCMTSGLWLTLSQCCCALQLQDQSWTPRVWPPMAVTFT